MDMQVAAVAVEACRSPVIVLRACQVRAVAGLIRRKAGLIETWLTTQDIDVYMDKMDDELITSHMRERGGCRLRTGRCSRRGSASAKARVNEIGGAGLVE